MVYQYLRLDIRVNAIYMRIDYESVLLVALLLVTRLSRQGCTAVLSQFPQSLSKTGGLLVSTLLACKFVNACGQRQLYFAANDAHFAITLSLV